MRSKIFTSVLGALTLLCSAMPSYADNVKMPVIPNSAQKVVNFIPQGYKLLKKAEGDLNKDKLTDTAIVVEDKAGNRVLLILFAKKNKSFSLASSTQSVLCRECGGVFGDPFNDGMGDALKIEKGVLVIGHYGGSCYRWGFTDRFRFQNNNFYLIGEDILVADSALGESRTQSTNFLTGDVILEKYGPGDKLLKRKSLKVKTKKLIELSKFNIDDYSNHDYVEEMKI